MKSIIRRIFKKEVKISPEGNFEKYIYKIRNFQFLKDYEIQDIKSFDDKGKYEIIKEYNKVLACLWI